MTGNNAILIAQALQESREEFKGLPTKDLQLPFFGMYLLTGDVGYYPGDWPKRERLLDLFD